MSLETLLLISCPASLQQLTTAHGKQKAMLPFYKLLHVTVNSSIRSLFRIWYAPDNTARATVTAEILGTPHFLSNQATSAKS